MDDLMLPRTAAGSQANTRAQLVGQFMGNSGRMYAMQQPPVPPTPSGDGVQPGVPGAPGAPGGGYPGALPPGLAQMAGLPPGLVGNTHASFLRAPGGAPVPALGGQSGAGAPIQQIPEAVLARIRQTLAQQFTLPAYAPRG